jgi:hypothetical protein
MLKEDNQSTEPSSMATEAQGGSTTRDDGRSFTACPYCAERIMPSARKCRFCGEWLDRRSDLEPSTNDSVPLPSPQAKTSGRAVASFALALLGGGLGAIPAVVLGSKALKEIRASSGHLRGEGWAYVGGTAPGSVDS